MRFFPVTAALVVALLDGCSMIPAYQRPDAPVSPTFPGDNAGTTGIAAADLQWQSFFSDARLKLLIDLALVNNRDLRVSVLNIEQARAQFQIRRADQYPTVGAALTGSRTPTAAGGITSVYTAGLTISAWEIDFFGRIASLKEAALSQYLATEENRKAAQISLIAAVATGYLNVLADEDLLDLTRQTLSTREESIKLTKLRFDNGVASELDYQQAQSLVEGARVTLAQLQRQRALDGNALVLLVGQSLPADALPPAIGNASLTAGTRLPDVPAGVPSELLTRRPDIWAAEQQLVAANANIGAARAAFFPRISLTAGVGTASNQLSGLFKSGSFGWTLAPQLLLPIFDAGRNTAGLASANVVRDIAIAQYEKVVQSAFREVADALAGRATLTEQLRAQEAQAFAEGARFKLSDLRYRNGVASYLDLLDAQRSLFVARQAVVQTRLLQLQNQVALYRTLGGGWTEPPVTAAAQGARQTP
ncbi:MAG: efflux transporter outer membrane subunit [Burkholderiaceae bacterium]|nr:efflux transporter outer membrane subunit [Burkholderiaceae bacterium]